VPPFNILLVEDDVDVREALAEALSDRGYAVDTAGDGLVALQVLRGGKRPGVILLDLMMPRMDGVEFRSAQRADPKLADLPVVLLSADARMEEKARAMKVQDAIRKPIDLEQLYRVIERIGGGSKERSQ
jgi:two-component system chemotaxis response regulator CheY